MNRWHNLLFTLTLVLLAMPAFAEDDGAEATTEPANAEAAPEPANVDAAPEPANVDAAPEPASVEAVAEPTSIEAMLEAENAERARVNRIGMGVLGAWALGNIGWGTVGLLTTAENPKRSFHLTNAAWNLVNGLIATVGYFSNSGADAKDLDLVETVSASHNIEKVLLLNAGLDAAYIAGGAYLIVKGVDEQKDGLVGTGRSVILQGAFLLVFDATMYAIHALRRNRFQRAIQGAQ